MVQIMTKFRYVKQTNKSDFLDLIRDNIFTTAEKNTCLPLN